MAFGRLGKFYIRKLVLNKRAFVILLFVSLLLGVFFLRINREVREAEQNIPSNQRIVVHSKSSEQSETPHKNRNVVISNNPSSERPKPVAFKSSGGPVSTGGNGPWNVVKTAKYPMLEGAPECVFSSVTPVAKPTVNMVDVMESLPFDNPNGGVWKQGFDISYQEEDFQRDPLRVFIVPHSHNDPGWLYTFEEYYQRQTRSIFDNVVRALSEAKERKFIYAEMSFLDLWWKEQSESRKNEFRRLVDGKQLEIVTGGWVMNDEANTHYYAMLDQLMEGHWWLKDNLPGVKPKSGWAIDPFGHTPTMAYLLKKMGFDNMLIQRVHYSVKKELATKKQLEFLWRQEWDHHGNTDMFCHMMPFYSYDIPHTCGPDPKICCQFDFKRLPSLSLRVTCPWRVSPESISPGNVEQRAKLLLDQYKKKAQLFRTNVLLVPLGDDFRYDNWKEVVAQYTNYKQLIDYMNSHPELNVKAQIGTLSDYFDALRTTGNLGDFPVLSGDFYTYSDRDQHYWSGYYTSRPFYKRFDRILENYLRSADILYSLGVSRGLLSSSSHYHRLVDARRSLGLFQHHDGITGTAREKVVVDYAQKMLKAIHNSQEVMVSLAQEFLHGSSSSDVHLEVNLQQTTYNGLPTPVFLRVNQKRDIVLYNSLAEKRVRLVRLVVDSILVSVSNENGDAIPCQINPVWTDLTEFATDKFELVFPVTMEGISLLRYGVTPSSTVSCVLAEVQLSNPDTHGPSAGLTSMQERFGAKFPVTVNPQMSTIIMETVSMTAEFDGQTGLLQSLVVNGVKLPVSLDFVMYGTMNVKEKSGAYLFIPDGPASSIVTNSQHFVRIVTGNLVKEVHSNVHSSVVHKVVMENLPGPAGRSLAIINDVNIALENNKELAMRLRSGVKNKDRVFYTDVNGFQLVHRKTQDKLPLQGNFYPLPSMAHLEDQDIRLSLLTAQPLGTGALQQGWLEVMLDRRLMQDDNRGLSQGVKDNLLTRSSFRLLVEQAKQGPPAASTIAYPSLLAHTTSMELLHPVQVFVAKETTSANFFPKNSMHLTAPLPCDLHVVTMRTHRQSAGSQTALVLHRKGFSCFHDNAVDCNLTQGKVNLKQFLGVDLKKVSKTSLTMMESFEELRDLNVQVDPMELQTFSIEF